MRRASLFTGAFLALGVGFLGTIMATSHSHDLDRSGRGVTPADPPLDAVLDRQVWFVYVGNPDCGWSERPEAKDAIRAVWHRLERRAAQEGVELKAVGVATTADVSRGLNHLSDLGDFDSFSFGDHVSNAVTLDYFWADGVIPSTPQVLVFERTGGRSDPGSLVSNSWKPGVRHLGRASGLTALRTWAASDLVLPPRGATTKSILLHPPDGGS